MPLRNNVVWETSGREENAINSVAFNNPRG